MFSFNTPFWNINLGLQAWMASNAMTEMVEKDTIYGN